MESKEYGEKTVIVNADEFKELQEYKERYENESYRSSRLDAELADVKKRLKNEQDKNKNLTIEFQTFIKEPVEYYPGYVQTENLISTIQFPVSTDIVGYERDEIFKHLNGLADAMKDELDAKYDAHLKELAEKYNKLYSDYISLVKKVDDFNEKHLFKVKY